MGKNKESSGAAVETSGDAPIIPPAIRPPGRMGTKGRHGPHTGRLQTVSGSLRLRGLLSLSGDVAIETVCDEAAAEIESLRATKSAPTGNWE